MEPSHGVVNSATHPTPKKAPDAFDPWDAFETLMEVIAAGSIDPGSHGAEVDPRHLPRKSLATYRFWLDYYQQHFPDRRYPCAQAFLNTHAAQALLPPDYLYGTSIFLGYNPLNVRIMHLLDSSRFLYFQTSPSWTQYMLDCYQAPLRFDTLHHLLEAARHVRSGGGLRQLGSIGSELRQLASKYRTFLQANGTEVRPTEQDYKPLASVAELGQFLDRWLGSLEADLAKVAPGNGPALPVETDAEVDGVFAKFSLLDLFDLAYLLELREKSQDLRDFVKDTTTFMRQNNTYSRELQPRDPKFALFHPRWVSPGLIDRIITFPVACQAFDQRQSATDDVLFVGFCGRQATESRKALPGPDGSQSLAQLRAVVSLITSTSLNELRRIQVLDEARHSAVAAIMGRNLSHNIGSHVLHWLIRNDEEEIRQAAAADGDTIKTNKITFKRTARRRVFFLRYLRERMDYIATITRPVAWLSYSAPLSALVSPLSRDAAISEEDSDPALTLLLKNIGRSDNVNQFDIRAESGAWTSFQRINVALFHGASGRQAFYTIVENIIRNSAKHQSGKDIRTVTIGIAPDQPYPDYLKVQVKDGVTPATEETLSTMRQALHGWICDREGHPLMKQLGFKEMRISAAFLRMIDPARVDDLHDPDLIALEKSDGLVAHTFFMLKARDVLFVMAPASRGEADWERLKDFGVAVMAPGDEAARASLVHRFTVLLDDQDAEVKAWSDKAWAEAASGSKPLLPVRSFRVRSLPERKEGCTITPDEAQGLRLLLDRAVHEAGSAEAVLELKDAVYDLWLRHRFGVQEAGVQIAVFGETASWVSSCEGGFTTVKNPFKIKDETRLSTRELATLFPPGTFDPKRLTAVLAHHGLLPRLEAAREDDNVVFAQEWSSGSPSGTFLTQSLEPSATRLLMREMREAVLSKVLIIDERLAADPLGSDHRRLMHCAGIELIGKEFPELLTAGAIEIAWPWQRPVHFDYVSIHFGLIEKSARDLQMPLEACKTALLARLKEIAWVVLVHSGRGRPDLPPGVRYIDLSTLESLLNEDKRTLVIGLGAV